MIVKQRKKKSGLKLNDNSYFELAKFQAEKNSPHIQMSTQNQSEFGYKKANSGHFRFSITDDGF